MKRKITLLLVFFICSIVFIGSNKNSGISAAGKSVQILDRSDYYEVKLDFNKQPSHRKMGEAYATEILSMVPNYEYLLDSYLQYLTGILDGGNTTMVVNRINDLKPQINQKYRDEIEGMASKFSGANQDILGDGKLSLNEIYMFNLMPEVCIPTQCSALGVYGARSASGKTIAYRTVDWMDGSQNQMAQFHAVTTYKNYEKSIVTIGYLGFVGVISGFNQGNVFAGILCSNTEQPYTSASRSSFIFDLRTALESYNTLDAVGNYLKSSTRIYPTGHLIFLCSPNTCKVLENNISSGGIRELRTANSALNNGITWGISNAVGCVNSFILKGNSDNHSSAPSNSARWANMRSELVSKGNVITLEELKAIASFHTGSYPGSQSNGDLYSEMTHQVMIIEPDKSDMQIFFRPKQGNLPNTPIFKRVQISFN